ncbi:hypothetical protein PsorP6_004486 [Peronosclerospora sorghi]|uniref:Uncharacterized protein n=1 Tax=Peronosclerospora sorghi TaxID=230839 RepID=A0ACC0VP17_9STRA|nr:hypothetical protein PsorP6_004486 [Peronosclerospora sorghi]
MKTIHLRHNRASKKRHIPTSAVLEDCRMISDDGLAAIASSGDPEGCSNLELVDLKVRVASDSDVTLRI